MTRKSEGTDHDSLDVVVVAVYSSHLDQLTVGNRLTFGCEQCGEQAPRLRAAELNEGFPIEYLGRPEHPAFQHHRPYKCSVKVNARRL